MRFEEHLSVIGELSGNATARDGSLKHEFASRSDGVIEADAHADHVSSMPTVTVSGRTREAIRNIADENRAAAALAHELSLLHGRRYDALAKVEEDSDFPDVWLRAVRGDGSAGERVGMQITHLDREAIKDLRRRWSFRREHTPESIADAAATAIAAKQRVDPKAAGATYLLLIVHYPITPGVARSIQAELRARATSSLYRQTWIYSFRQRPFLVHDRNPRPDQGHGGHVRCRAAVLGSSEATHRRFTRMSLRSQLHRSQ
jgi:hypothetical protein